MADPRVLIAIGLLVLLAVLGSVVLVDAPRRRAPAGPSTEHQQLHPVEVLLVVAVLAAAIATFLLVALPGPDDCEMVRDTNTGAVVYRADPC